MDANVLISKFSIISRKSFETYLSLDESCGLLPLSDISDHVKDKEHYEKDNVTSRDQLRRKTEEKSCL